MKAAIALILFSYIWWGDFNSSKSMGDRKGAKDQVLGLLTSVLIIAISLLIVNQVIPKFLPPLEESMKTIIILISSIVLSGMISFIWYLFISWLDIYEKEKFIYIFITFALACGSTYLVFVITPFWDSIGFELNGNFVNDFAYSCIRIGLTEEIVKFLPFLVMLLFSKQIDEPIDYILFGATSALGFAFIENILYIRNYELGSLNGRAFYASVSHMFDTGIICYLLAIAKHKGKSLVIAGIKGFILASLAHGFYDFWLISDEFKYTFLTWGFFVISIHLFAIMKNNLINISPYYQPEKRLNVIQNKNRLFNLLLFIMFVGYISYTIVHGVDKGNDFLNRSIVNYTFILVYLVLSFNSTNIIHGYIAPIGSLRVFLLPLINRYPNYLGCKVMMKETLQGNEVLHSILPLQGVLSKRVVVNDDFNWYEFHVEEEKPNMEVAGTLIIKPARTEYHLFNRKYQIFKIGFVKDEVFTSKVSFEKKEVRLIGDIKVRSYSND